MNSRGHQTFFEVPVEEDFAEKLKLFKPMEIHRKKKSKLKKIQTSSAIKPNCDKLILSDPKVKLHMKKEYIKDYISSVRRNN